MTSPIAAVPDLCPAQFARCLDAQNGHACAGYPASETDCPLARFLRGTRWPQAVVGFTTWRPSPARSKPLPPWAVSFQERACQAVERTKSGGLSVARARRIVAEVTP